MKTLFAWTAPGGDYPSYLNVSEGDDGSGNPTISVTVRSPKGTGQATAGTTIPAVELRALIDALQRHAGQACDAERYRKLRAASIACCKDCEITDWELALTIADNPLEFDGVVDGLPSAPLREGSSE